MKVQLVAISTLSIAFSQYNVFDINNYNYFQDSIRVSSPVPMFKSFILPGWGQLSKKDSKWKSFIFFSVEIITVGSNLHYSKKSNDFKNNFENGLKFLLEFFSYLSKYDFASSHNFIILLFLLFIEIFDNMLADAWQYIQESV